MDSICTELISDTDDPIQALGTMVHVKESVVMELRRVENVLGSLIGQGIGEHDWIDRVALKFHGDSF
jgi:hypothetical protein